MAKKDRNKRSARKARQTEREQLEASQATPASAKKQQKAVVEKQAEKKAQAPAGDNEAALKAIAKEAKKAQKKSHADALNKKARSLSSKPKKKDKKKGFFSKVATYFRGVRQELKRVTWPTKKQLFRLTVAVMIMVIVAGFCIWAIDTGAVQVLLHYNDLRTDLGWAVTS